MLLYSCSLLFILTLYFIDILLQLEPYDWASWMVILIFSVHCCGTAMFIYEWLSPRGLDRGNVPPRGN